VKQDYPGFATAEMKDRKEVGLPPFSRIVRLVLRDQDQEKLNKLAGEVAAQLLEAAAIHGDQVVVRGPAPCAINRIANYHRVEIRLISPSPSRLQNILATVREKGALARSARIAVDVDPVSLL
jgi:primosomal protein N' (replication factor Y)